jgi:hypothetical protein
MLKTNVVDLEALGISLASDRLGVVVGQLCVNVTAHEPYRCKPELVGGQLEAIAATLAVSRACQHGVAKTHFTLFPEYGLPGIAGVDLIDGALLEDAWPTGSIVIAGVHGLAKAEFAELAGRPATHLCAENAVEKIKDGEWVNCSITWVKHPPGVVERWIQPKLSPAWPEANFDDAAMYRGKSVWVFRGKLDDDTIYRFCTLICYDWVGPATGAKNWNSVFAQLQAELEASGGEEMSVSWFFVIQRNPKPSHSSFLNEVGRFYDQTTVKKIKRDKTGLLFANSAAKPRPGKSESYGGTSLVFSKQTLFKEGGAQPTYSTGGLRYRGSDLLNGYLDNYFRERGACVQSFAVVNPGSLQAGAAGKQIAIERAFVFPLYGVSDPRVPGNIVSASIKWLNDELDDIHSLADKYPNDALADTMKGTHQSVIAGLRTLPSSQAGHAVALATSETGPKERNADNWDVEERRALVHVINTLDIFALAGEVSHHDGDIGHGVGQIGGVDVDIVAVLGETHEKCLSHTDKKVVPGVQRRVVVVMRDEDNQAWDPREGKFLRAGPEKLGAELKITDPQSQILHMGYSNLLNMYRQSATAAELEAKLNAAAA